MSLINQMLKDLEQRRTPAGNDSSAVLDRLNPGTATAQGRRGYGLLILTGILLVTVVILAWVVFGERWTAVQTSGHGTVSKDGKKISTIVPLAPPIVEQASQPAPEPGKITEPVRTVEKIVPQVKQPEPEVAKQLAEVEIKAPSQPVVDKPMTVKKTIKQPPVIEVTKPVKKADKPVEVAPRITRKPTISKEGQASSLFAKATRQLKKAERRKAEQSLLEVLKLLPTHIDARQTLAAMHFSGKQFNAAQRVLIEGRALHPQHVPFTLLLARVHTEQGQDNEAIAVLETMKPVVSQNSDYYALLAALYQRSAKHAAAARTYQALLQVYPRRGVWWMGLGLSLQAQQQPGAIQAYRNALASGDLSTELKRFVQSRINGLK